MRVWLWAGKAIKKLTVSDFVWVKISVFSFSLFLVKLFPVLLTCEWGCYLSIALVAMIKPWMSILKS